MKQIGVASSAPAGAAASAPKPAPANPLVKSLHIAETRPERLRRDRGEDRRARPPPRTTASCSRSTEIDAVMISATPETTHYPMARDCLLAGKHVFLEKPIAIELHEADELIAIARKQQAQVHDRLLAALQPQVRVRQEGDRATARSASR